MAVLEGALEDDATAFPWLFVGVDPLPDVSWTDIVRASAILSFLRSRALGSPASSFFRFGGIVHPGRGGGLLGIY